MAKIQYCDRCEKRLQNGDKFYTLSGHFNEGSKYEGCYFEFDLCVSCFDKFYDSFEWGDEDDDK